MKNQEQIIKKLIEMAIEHYVDGLHADIYATTAAHAFARALAAENGSDCADPAAYVAGTEYATLITNFTHYLAKLGDSQTKLRHDMNNHRAKADPHSERKSNPLLAGIFFEKVAALQGNASIELHAHELYHSTFDTSQSESYRLAVIAACANYSHAHASARSAYLYAIKIAAPYPTSETRRTAFTIAFTARLSADLTLDPIEPSFFMAIICSDTVNVISWLLLIGGLMALSLGLAGFGIASVGAVMASTGLSNASLAIAGAAMTATGAGVFTCRFFTTRQWQQDNETSRNAVAVFNDPLGIS